MKKPIIIVVIIAVLLCLLGSNGCSTYNKMTSADQEVESAWGEVQNQYQRRFDLIPNLVETVKGYAKHESETFETVTRARAGLSDAYNNAQELKPQSDSLPGAQQFEQYNQAQADLNRALSIYVNAVREAYPELKADQQFRDLQVQLEGTENRIATARTRYIGVVKDYNLRVKRFPAKIWASIFGFEAKPQFQADSEAQSAPKVQF